ncbi:ATP-binding protein [Streptomyces microflavus]|uniref:ATP-binding protein n=1 Tax=Streptomyces microflavus TaxID=1919 RepID=UPI0038171D87
MSRLHLPATVDAPCAARHWAAEQLPDDIRETALLLISELVTNAVLASRSAPAPPTVTLEVAVEPGRVALYVTDASSRPLPPAPETVPADAESGRGLLLVATLADEHGWAPSRCGKCVWAALNRCPGATAIAPVECVKAAAR